MSARGSQSRRAARIRQNRKEWRQVQAALEAERIALSILDGRVTAQDAREDLHLTLQQAETERAASSLRAYRNGEPAWTWPATVPWDGF
jgi:hypothetical protein